MARIFIDLPESFSFTTELPLYYTHINAAGHLDNAMLLSLVSEARLRYFTELGFKPGGTRELAVFTGDAAVQYLSEGFYGETMVVAMRARDFNRYGCDMAFRVSDKASGREVARGKIGLVFYDKQAGKVAPIPVAIREKLSL